MIKQEPFEHREQPTGAITPFTLEAGALPLPVLALHREYAHHDESVLCEACAGDNDYHRMHVDCPILEERTPPDLKTSDFSPPETPHVSNKIKSSTESHSALVKSEAPAMLTPNPHSAASLAQSSTTSLAQSSTVRGARMAVDWPYEDHAYFDDSPVEKTCTLM